MKKIFLLIFSFLFYPIFISLSAQCNGNLQLCNKRFDQVAFPTTHNSFACADNDFTLPNQSRCIEQQLEDGIRGLMLDVYKVDSSIVVYHSFAAWGTTPLSDIMTSIKNFLDENPTEIISIIFQSSILPSDIEDMLIEVDLMTYLHNHTLGTTWATLQEMIDANERLVIFSETDNGIPEQTWHHYAWAHIFDTDYSYNAPEDFHCGVNRGDTTNALYLVNHWITTMIGVGDSTYASTVNSNPFLLDRLRSCQEERGRMPNFVGVDFYHIGDLFAAIDSLNDFEVPTSIATLPHKQVLFYPNPVKEVLNIELSSVLEGIFTIHNIEGQIILEEEARSFFRVDCSQWESGVYFFRYYNAIEKSFFTAKLVKVK